MSPDPTRNQNLLTGGATGEGTTGGIVEGVEEGGRGWVLFAKWLYRKSVCPSAECPSIFVYFFRFFARVHCARVNLLAGMKAEVVIGLLDVFDISWTCGLLWSDFFFGFVLRN